MRTHTFFPLFATFGLLLAATWAFAQGKPAKVDHGINKPFENPDVKGYVKKFESDSREVYSRRDEIVAALGLKPGMAVADVGAGTGLFTKLIAAQVGPKGKVYAVDISPAFLKHIAAESKRLRQSQVQTIRGDQESTALPADSIDLAFICDVYHHMEQPAKNLATIHEALRTGGELVLIEFDRVDGKSKPFVLEHVRAGKAVFIKEIESAGFRRVEDPEAPRLTENFFARFRKVDKPAIAPRRK